MEFGQADRRHCFDTHDSYSSYRSYSCEQSALDLVHDLLSKLRFTSLVLLCSRVVHHRRKQLMCKGGCGHAVSDRAHDCESLEVLTATPAKVGGGQKLVSLPSSNRYYFYAT